MLNFFAFFTFCDSFLEILLFYWNLTKMPCFLETKMNLVRFIELKEVILHALKNHI